MRPYEVMVIFDVDLEEGDIRQRVDRVHELLRAKGGNPGSVHHWGRRTFAYEIKHRSEGYYVVLEATAEPSAMADVDRYLALEDAVLRHKVIRQPEGVAGRSSSNGRSRRTASTPPETKATSPEQAPAPATEPSGVAEAAPIAAAAADTITGADASPADENPDS